MSEEKKPERRRRERRSGKERRSEQFEETYRRLVEKGIFVNARRSERRKGERRRGNGLSVSDEERYALYIVGMNRINLERKKEGLPPEKVFSFSEWKLRKN